MEPNVRPSGVFVGLTTLDSIARLPHAPAANEKVVAASHELAAGGPATNAAVTFAALGGDAFLVTALGRHPFALAAKADLEACGVHVWDVEPDRTVLPPMAHVTVSLATGERSVVLAPAAPIGEPLAPRMLAEFAHLAGGADVAACDGHHPPLVRALCEALPEGVDLVLDAGSWKPVLAEVLPRVTVAACSADFRLPGTPSRSHAGPNPLDEAGDPGRSAPPEDLRAALLEGGPRAAVVTHGADPVEWRTTDPTVETNHDAPADDDTDAASKADAGSHGSWRSNPDPPPAVTGADAGSRTAGTVSVPAIKVADTLGAGDVFHGALAYSLAVRPAAPLQEHITFANEVAALRCGHVGVRAWLTDPKLLEIARRHRT